MEHKGNRSDEVKAMIIQYNRQALSMGDDVYNGIYKITMPEDATLGDLIEVLLRGGNGNDWPIPMTSVIGWAVYENIGKVADVSADKKRIVYCIADAQTKLLELGIEWVFGERETSTPDIDELDRMFRFF